jgi:hypothetical protein
MPSDAMIANVFEGKLRVGAPPPGVPLVLSQSAAF